MKSIAIYCGSSSGTDPIYMKDAYQLGGLLAAEGIDLVYGGARVGLMGAVADGALNNGGKVIGVLPNFLGSQEIAHPNLTELIMVETMHERKAIIEGLVDAAIALPGGFGTMDELFEMLTWGQLNIHEKAIGILNTHGYYNYLLQQIQHMVKDGFLKKINAEMLIIGQNSSDLLEQLKSYQPASTGKWINP